jgi:phage baseplate assembly protein V
MLMVGRGTVNLTDDGQGQQRMQVSLLAGETRDQVDRIQPYGLSSHPAPGGTAIVVCLGGSRDHPVCIAVDEPRARPTGLAAGEVVLWSAHGQRVLLREDRGLEITTPDGVKMEMTPDGKIVLEAIEVVMKASARVRMETPSLEVTGMVIEGAA